MIKYPNTRYSAQPYEEVDRSTARLKRTQEVSWDVAIMVCEHRDRLNATGRNGSETDKKSAWRYQRRAEASLDYN